MTTQRIRTCRREKEIAGEGGSGQIAKHEGCFRHVELVISGYEK